MYSGPGPGALLAAAGSWDSLSAELGTTALAYESALRGLTSLQWRGPSAEAMLITAGPYVGWLQATAEQAMHTAMQARIAAAAFELAYAMTLPPAAVEANRVQLAALIATNFFGQNTAAIAVTEAQYAEYWAQDVTAMSGYAASSAEATQLTGFSSARQTTNQDGGERSASRGYPGSQQFRRIKSLVAGRFRYGVAVIGPGCRRRLHPLGRCRGLVCFNGQLGEPRGVSPGRHWGAKQYGPDPGPRPPSPRSPRSPLRPG